LFSKPPFIATDALLYIQTIEREKSLHFIAAVIHKFICFFEMGCIIELKPGAETGNLKLGKTKRGGGNFLTKVVAKIEYR